MKSVIVYGHQGSGKNLHVQALLKALKLKYVNQDWSFNMAYIPADTLLLTHEEPPLDWPGDLRPVLSLAQALKKVKS